MRHGAVFEMTSEAFCAMFREGDRIGYLVTRGLPADAKVVDAKFDGFRGVIVVAVESPTLYEVPEGGEFPRIEPRMERIG